MSQHPQVEVMGPLGPCTVDEELVELLHDCWARGLLTWASCQDWGDGTAQIVFACEEMADHFAREMTHEARPAGWRFRPAGAPFPDSPPMMAVYFPRALLTADVARQGKVRLAPSLAPNVCTMAPCPTCPTSAGCRPSRRSAT